MTDPAGTSGPHTPPASTPQESWFDAHRDYVPGTLPDGSIPIPMYGLRICVALGMDGQPMYTWRFDNEEGADRFQLIGFLTALSIDITRKHVYDAIEDITDRLPR